jgi:hypothetical protein
MVTTMDATLRILRHKLSRSPRRFYWDARALGAELAATMDGSRRDFRAHVIRDELRFVTGRVRPIEGETQMRAHAAADWLLRAQTASADGGVSYGYFPCRGPERGWKPSYPETTGYIMTSLLEYSRRFPDRPVADQVRRMALWEADIQMKSGAVQGGPVQPPEKQTPAAFNTGMVLDGWCSAYAAFGDERILQAARAAADWLANDLDERGYFRTNGEFVGQGDLKVYTCLCAWAMYRLGDIVNDERYRRSAVRAVEAALAQQQPNGWFSCNCLMRPEAPLTHTIGYTLQGIAEVGALAGRDDFIGATSKAIDQLAQRVTARGYLPGCFYADWQPAIFSACLTGSAQVAIVAYRLYELRGRREHRQFADLLVNWLKGVQAIDAPDINVNGAIAGSFPIFGEYMRGGYPNWATKYLLDALLLQDRVAVRAAG